MSPKLRKVIIAIVGLLILLAIYALLPHPQPVQKEQEFTTQEKLIINKAIKKHGNHLIERMPNGKLVMIRCEKIKLN
jgi:hypothetical protein